jgi:hypothetical protein
MFTYDDIVILRELLNQFDLSWTTNSILTEVSNLLQHAPAYRRPALMTKLAEYASSMSELNIPSSDLVRLDAFFQLGLTDAGLSEFAKTYTVVTTDFHLAGRILSSGYFSINFNHLRGSHLIRL